MTGFPMRPFVLAAALVLAAGAARADDSCVQCHRGLDGKAAEPVLLSEKDIHFQRGLTCTACHGGDGATADRDAAHSPSAGFKGTPRGPAVLETCGRCHSDPSYMKDFNPAIRVDQVAQYSESHHGRKLLSGDGKAATCVSCHGNHGILPARDPASPVFAANIPATCGKCHGDAEYMKGRDIPTDVVEKYRRGVHGQALLGRGDLAAPACNSCHGNHGATPPEVASVANVCGTCHIQQADLFRSSVKKEIFDMNDLPECVFCHSQHDIQRPTDAMLGVGPASVCVQCHEDADDQGYVDARRMAEALAGLDGRIARASEVLEHAEHAGMEVSGAQFRLSEARDELTQARVLIHGFETAKVLERTAKGDKVAVDARGEGEMALSEIDYRKRGLYVSLIAIALLAVGIWLKVRDVDRQVPPIEADPG